MARGRFHWGIGSSSTPGDYEMFGFDPDVDDRRQYTRDAIDIILQIWNDPKPGLYESKHWRFKIPEPVEEIGLMFHLTPYTKPHPPITVGGVSPRSETLILAGERGWIPISINLVLPAVVKTHFDAFEEGANNVGRTADRSTWRIAREVYVAETTERARKEALDGILRRDFEDYWFKLLKGKLENMKLDPDMSDSDVTAEYLLDALWIVGSPDDVAEKLRKLHHDVGGFGVLLAMGHEWEPREQWVNSMAMLANEVMPKLADLN